MSEGVVCRLYRGEWPALGIGLLVGRPMVFRCVSMALLGGGAAEVA